MSRTKRTGMLVAKSICLAIVALSIQATAQAAPPHGGPETRAHSGGSLKAPGRAAKYPRAGHEVRSLPKGHTLVRVNRHNYHYHHGVFYRPRSHGSYVVVRAPLGARVRHLPAGYISFLIGPRRHYYVNYTYYLRDRETAEYVVVAEPEGAEAALVAASESVSGDIFVYPSQGQTDAQRDRDRYDCYLWAVEQTGFDPSAADSAAGNAADYRRAITACLEGRGYTVK